MEKNIINYNLNELEELKNIIENDILKKRKKEIKTKVEQLENFIFNFKEFEKKDLLFLKNIKDKVIIFMNERHYYTELEILLEKNIETEYFYKCSKEVFVAIKKYYSVLNLVDAPPSIIKLDPVIKELLVKK